ncbi:MAG: type VI secretion system protein ImpF [Pseudohongiellaceae bacterium]|jgi:type VI secretion system protein ImpF
MARLKTDQPILPSLLDRLIDNDVDYTVDTVKSTGVVLTEIRHNIRRDLENLLNTRVFLPQGLGDNTELEVSPLNYGLEDFSRTQFDVAEHREAFRDKVWTVINCYEPRFESVRVEINAVDEEYSRTLYLKISAVLMIEPDPVPLIFDTRVQNVEQGVKLRELRHG